MNLRNDLVLMTCCPLFMTLAACGGAPEGEQHEDSLASVSAALSPKCGPQLPDPSLAVPAGNKLAFALDAIGAQIYTCQATATGYAWTFQAPEAELLNDRGRVVGTHYAGPTWEYQDGSKVVAARVAGFTADPSAIPLLLLSAVSHAGEGRMSKVTYIQRLDTAGGLAPTSGCDAAHVAEVARVEYVATYYFYKASKR